MWSVNSVRKPNLGARSVGVHDWVRLIDLRKWDGIEVK